MMHLGWGWGVEGWGEKADNCNWITIQKKRHDPWAGVFLWWSFQSLVPIAAAFWIIWIVSTEECSSSMQNLMQIHCSTHSDVLSTRATQSTCSLKDVYCPTDKYSEVVIVQACTFQSILFGCQITLMSCNNSYYINNGLTTININYYKPTFWGRNWQEEELIFVLHSMLKEESIRTLYHVQIKFKLV